MAMEFAGLVRPLAVQVATLTSLELLDSVRRVLNDVTQLGILERITCQQNILFHEQTQF